MLEDTITLPSQASGCEQLSDDAWDHDNVTTASWWLGLMTMLGTAITLPSQAAGYEQLSVDA